MSTNTETTFIHVQVVFAQGKVKSFIAPKEILMDDFIKVIRMHGKVKRLRYQPDVSEQEATKLVMSGNATMVETRGQQNVQS